MLPTLVPGRGRAQRCCRAGGALTRLGGQPGGQAWRGLVAEADTFSVKLAEAHSQDSKVEEKGEREGERPWLTVGGLEKRKPAAQK